MAKPTVADLKEANKIIRRIRNGSRPKLVFKSGIDFYADGAATIAAHDASFDNMPKHKSQRGYFLMVGEREIVKDHKKLHRVHLVGWSSGRIHRAVRSTLAAEAYSCSEGMDNMFCPC